MNVGLGIAAAQQLLGQTRIARDVVEPDGPHRDAVEVGADADMIDARDLHQVVDMIGHVAIGSSAPAWILPT